MVKETTTNYGTLHFSVNMSGKMEGINSFSTSVLCNPICQTRRNIEGSICQKCFADTTCKRYTNLAKNLEENFDIITNYILEDKEIPFINDQVFRYESFGDVFTVIQCLNYINIAKKNPKTIFTAWTKNDIIWNTAFLQVEKPSNLIMGLSSLFINQVVENKYNWVDFVFTVYTAKYAIENNIKINCGNKKCLSCLKCYTKHDGIIYVNEILKSDIKKFLAMGGKVER